MVSMLPYFAFLAMCTFAKKVTVEIKEQPLAEDDAKWTRVELHGTGIDEINWHDHLQFYWNTPILTASSDPEMHPFLQENIFPDLHELLKVLPQTDDRFGDLYNISDIEALLDEVTNTEQDEKKKQIYSSFQELITMYKKRIVSWMALYSRGQCVVHTDLNSLYLLILSPGEIIPLHGAFNFPVNNQEHESHDLISIFSIQPESFYAKKESEDGIFIYDPRGTAAGYGFANIFIHTSQSEQLNTRGGYLHVFPSGIKFNTLPVEYTRVFLVSFARLYSIHQPYRRSSSARAKQAESANANIPIYHFQAARSTYLPKNDEPFFDQNVQFFSSFGTPVFRSSMANYKSLSVPPVEINADTLAMLSRCFSSYASRTNSVRKSNRNGWQSTADMLSIYKSTKWMIGEHSAENAKCIAAIDVLYDYLIEQVSLWLLSFSNSYYFDDNGLIINFQTMNDNKIYIDIIDSWININRGIAMNVPHSHPNSDLSGVIYIEIPDAEQRRKRDVDVVGEFDGDLFFEDPRTNLFDNNMRLQFAQFNEPLQITPHIGDVVLFPSWLRHWTMPSYDEQHSRISFAFNVKFRGIHIQREYEHSRATEKEETPKTRSSADASNAVDGLQILKREL